MTMRSSLVADADGLSRPGLRLPAAFVQAVIPLVVYAAVAKGQGTVESWQPLPGAGGSETWTGARMHVELLPSIWVLLLCVAIAVVGHVVARSRGDARRAADAHVTATMVIWAVVGLATFGGWAWLVVASAVGTDVGVPFPLMGTLSPLP